MSCLTQYIFFLYRWLKSPLSVGAIAPSGSGLARRIATRVQMGAGGECIELGAGTGSITRELLSAGVPPHALTVVEMDPAFTVQLKQRFPQANIVNADARNLARFAKRQVASIVSGLPLRNMKPRDIDCLTRTVSDQLLPGGIFIQFSYLPDCPVPRRLLRQYGFEVLSRSIVIWNLPPAYVWEFRRVPKQNESEGYADG